MPCRISLCTLTATLDSLAPAGGLLSRYTSQAESQWAQVEHVALSLPRLPRALDGLAIAQLSDIHAGHLVQADKIRHFVAVANALRPDITVVTGDMFHKQRVAAQMCADVLADLHAPLGVYAIMGNHERRLPPEHGEEPFRRAGLTVLCNAAHKVSANGASLWVVGMDDLIVHRGNLGLALRGVPEQACKILLVHEPDFADQAARFPIDLQLSGHTHGGQIRLPGIGPLLLPTLGRKYPMGLYRVQNTWVYTNRGLGVNRPRLRLNCPPEITLFTLHAAASDQNTDLFPP